MLIYPEEHLASQVKPQQMSQSSKLLFKTRRQLVVGFACCGWQKTMRGAAAVTMHQNLVVDQTTGLVR